MSQFFSVYSLSLCSLTCPKCLGYDEEEIEMKNAGEEARCYDRAISRSERCAELLRYPGRKRPMMFRREKKSAKRALCAFC